MVEVGQNLPARFGPYELLRRLAAGGMAEIYVAKALGVGGFEKLVAIKMIHPRYAEDLAFIDALVAEAKLLVLLTHASIAQVYDLCCIDGTYCIVMEYVEGADLHRLGLKARKLKQPLPVESALFIAAQVCAGLDYAHKKCDQDGNSLAIVHRDISPQNIVVSREGEVKLVDFGIAKATVSALQTEAGVIKGKYHYMSPEQSKGVPVDARTDIFSTGVVLYELLTGDLLYNEPNFPLLLTAVRAADIPPPSTRRPDLDPDLDALVMGALCRDPSKRYASANSFEQAILDCLHARWPGFAPSELVKYVRKLLRSDPPLAASVDKGKPRWKTLLRSERPLGTDTHVSASSPHDSERSEPDIDVRQAVREAMLASAGSLSRSATSLLINEGLAAPSSVPAKANVLSLLPVANVEATSEAEPAAEPDRFSEALRQLRVRHKSQNTGVNPLIRDPEDHDATRGPADAGAEDRAVARSAEDRAPGTKPSSGRIHTDANIAAGAQGPSSDRTPLRPASPRDLPREQVPQATLPVRPPGNSRAAALIGMTAGIVLVLLVAAVVVWGRLASATIRIESEPTGAYIQVNGVAHEDKTPASIEVVRGEGGLAEVTLVKDGYVPERVFVEPGQLSPLRVVLRPLSVTATVLSSPAGAAVFVNGVPYGPAPAEIPGLEVDAIVEVEVRHPSLGSAIEHRRVEARAKDRFWSFDLRSKVK